ncbi:MAG: NAD(P)H-hydrate epimerase [Acidimicrobiia bacterium]|nr:NAD(P)H-hydrate epimerase [Acidimicrobiia bacterium]
MPAEFERDLVPTVDRAQMQEVDRLMIETYGIQLTQMMENAGRNLADLAIERFSPDSVQVAVGSGGNGGGGLVAARHLANRGVEVSVLPATDNFKAVPQAQFDIIRKMKISIDAEVSDSAPLVIDALVGYSLDGAPRGRVSECIRAINERGTAVLSLDSPSGLDVTTGRVHDPCVVATATMTLALPKWGLSADVVGQLYLADISVPATLYADAFNLAVPNVFAEARVVRLV